MTSAGDGAGSAALLPTRRALHGVAELLLAGPQFRAVGRIRLAVTPDGFATVAEPHVRVAGTDVVVAGRRCPIVGTIRAIGAELGLEPGRPEGLYADGSGVGLDEELVVEAAEVRWITAAFNTGADALRRFAPDEEPVLWPEHFDVGIRVGEVNYGVSPGDDHLAEPYAYVGVQPRPEAAFWNAPFGAARPLSALTDVSAVVEFFAAGRDAAGSETSG